MIKNCLNNIILGFSAGFGVTLGVCAAALLVSEKEKKSADYSDVKVAYFSEEEPK